MLWLIRGYSINYHSVLFGFISIITEINPYSDGAHIAFLLDGSLGVSSFEYDRQKETVTYVVWALSWESTQFDAAVVEYSDEATLLFNFTQTYELYGILNYGLAYLPDKSDGRQRIDKALTFTSKYVFASTGQNIPKIAILFAFTEHLQPGYPLGKASESLRQKGVRILVFEVNPINPRKELLSVTEREDDLIHTTSSFEMTFRGGNDLLNKVLKASGEY